MSSTVLAPDRAAAGSADRTGGARRFRADIQGLRAVAVLLVVLYHAGVPGLTGGYVGVDVFFVISGFLITRLLLAEREKTGHIDLVAFWGRRFRRLLPALFVTLAAVAGAARLWMPSWRFADLRSDALATLAYVANWRFIFSGQSYFSDGLVPSPLRHAWSLAIEEQFYLLWPLIVMLILSKVASRYRLVLLVVSGVGAVASAAWMALAPGLGVDLSRLYYGTDSRAFALLAGAWLAAWWDPVVADAPRPVGADERSRPLTRAAGVALLPLLVLAFVGAEDSSWFYRIGFQTVAICSTVAVAGLATGEGPLGRLFGHPLLCWVGRRSYGIYLWSWPVQVYASSHFGLGGVALDATVVLVTLALATASFRFVEEPIRTHWGQPRPQGARAKETVPTLPVSVQFGMSVVAVVAIISVSTSGATPAPSYLKVSDAEAAAGALTASGGFEESGSADGGRITTTMPTGDEAPSTSVAASSTLPPPEGPPGPFLADAPTLVAPRAAVDPFDVNGRPLRVMIAGDSVGWSIGWQPSRNITSSVLIEDRAIIGCGVMPPESAWTTESHVEHYSKFCLEQDEAEKLGLESKPDVVLLWLGAWEVYDHILDGQELVVGSDAYAAVIEQRLQDRVDRFRAAGVPTVMPTVPCFGAVAPRLGTQRYDEKRRSWVNDRLLAVAARNRTWVRVINPTDMLCENGVAIDQTPDGTYIRADGAHFDTESAAWFWNNWLAGQLGAAYGA